MAKLDWSKVGLRLLDPARFQRNSDRVLTPDEPISKSKVGKPNSKSAIKLTRNKQHSAEEAKRQAAKAEKRLKHAENQAIAATKNAAAAERRAQQKLQSEARKKADLERKRAKEEARKLGAERRRQEFLEYQKTPQYAEHLKAMDEKRSALTKSHLEVWVERHTSLNVDRATLRERWRQTLFRGKSHTPPK